MKFFRPSSNENLIVSLSIVASMTGLQSVARAQQSSLEAAGPVQEVVVTGTRKAGESPTETLSPVDLIAGNVIADQASFDLTDSLSRISPSITALRYPIADGTSFIRPVSLRSVMA